MGNQVSQVLNHMKKGLSEKGIRHERFENSGSVWTGIRWFLQRQTLEVTQDAYTFITASLRKKRNVETIYLIPQQNITKIN